MEVLDVHLLRSVFEHVHRADVARLRAVCHGWKQLIDDSQVARGVFKKSFGLSDLLGRPRKPSFYLVANLPQLVIQHNCRHWETLTSVAVLHRVDVIAIRVLNNLITDHSLRSRLHVYVPVRQEQIPGKAGRCIYDSTVDRDLVVLADDVASLPESPPEVDKPKSIEDAVQKMSSLLGRGLRIDESSAKFYLREAGGDLKAAIRLYEDDRQWEQQLR